MIPKAGNLAWSLHTPHAGSTRCTARLHEPSRKPVWDISLKAPRRAGRHRFVSLFFERIEVDAEMRTMKRAIDFDGDD
jgi:hypothetical protein